MEVIIMSSNNLVFSSFIAIASLLSFAAFGDTINLGNGDSITLSGTTVTCNLPVIVEPAQICSISLQDAYADDPGRSYFCDVQITNRLTGSTSTIYTSRPGVLPGDYNFAWKRCNETMRRYDACANTP